MHQRTVIADAILAFINQIQLHQIALNADKRTAGGEHHHHTFFMRAFNGRFNGRRDLVLRIEQRAVHIDCNQFYSHNVLIESGF